MSIKVTLRRKPISEGRQCLYLDIYPPIPNPKTGKPTRREFLKLYITGEGKSSKDKETLRKAEIIRAERENRLRKPEIYTEQEKEQLRLKEITSRSFLDYFEKLGEKREGSTKVTWDITLLHLKKYAGTDLKFSDITEPFCLGFREFLLTDKTFKGSQKLSVNSASQYYSKLKTALKQAYKEGILQYDLNARLQGIPDQETRRNVLTLDEVNALISAECPHPVLKKAAIFSVFTGLRFSDMQNLTWEQIEERAPGEYVIHFKQQKTRLIETLPISLQAVEFIGERKGPKDKVFPGLMYSAYYNVGLAKWVGLAGITKDITFHSFRHTFATLHLTLGTDIYTVSKLLGHRDLKTTQIYAKIVDESKRTAVNRIQLDINNYK